MQTLDWLIRIAGVIHLGILIASALLPQVLDWRHELRKVSALSRHVIWVHGAFGLVSILLAGALTDGSILARAICGFIALFWSARLGIQFFLFDARPYLTRSYLTLGYHGLTVCFVYFAVVYTWAAVAPPVHVAS